MSPLIEGLERILKRFELHEPHRVEQMDEGLKTKDYSLRYNSLTALILHNAEWYETAIYHDGRWTLDHPSISHLLEYEIEAKYRP